VRSVPEEMVAKLRRASEMFASAGFEAARMEDLAKVTGIPTSTMYYYFAGKHEVLAFLVRDYLDNLAVRIADSLAGAEDATERLARILRAHLGVMAAQPNTCQVLLSELGRVGRLPELSEAVQSAVHRPLQKVLAEGVADGSFRPLDTETTTSTIYGAVTMTALHHLVAGVAFEPAQLAEDVLAVVLGGIRA
jgi:TetR/AcrR family transcriptional regulator